MVFNLMTEKMRSNLPGLGCRKKGFSLKLRANTIIVTSRMGDAMISPKRANKKSRGLLKNFLYMVTNILPFIDRIRNIIQIIWAISKIYMNVQ
jgi:hypothetical protein